VRIAFWGNFGTGNLGNECTLQAMVHNVRQRLPAAELVCICNDPDDASERHGIRALPIDPLQHRKREARAKRRPWALRILLRLAFEARGAVEAVRTMRTINMLVMTGTGMLSDTGEGPLGLTFQMLKWALAAAVWRKRLLFVSVGVEGISHPFSRFSVRTALTLAAYRSYRDARSRDNLAHIGFPSRVDPVYPDLAFSLPPPASGSRSGSAARGPRLALGLYDYSHSPDDQGRARYRSYLEKLRVFIGWAVEGGFEVQLVISDVSYDLGTCSDLLSCLEERGLAGRVSYEPAQSVEELIDQLAGADIVVGTRFHTVLLGLWLGKPVVSVAYERKNDELMAGMGLAAYCQPVEELDVARLIEQVSVARREAASITATVRAKAAVYRNELAEQYARLLSVA